MVYKIAYKIRFPLGAKFQKDPEYLFISKIYREIKDSTCSNSEGCQNCFKKDKCIYYYLSGENFEKYPSIHVKRNMINKHEYRSSDILELTFYLIGTAKNYSEFILAYFDTEDYIVGNFYQKVLISKEVIDDKVIDGIVKIENVFMDCNDLIDSVNYYNKKYNCSFSIPTINIKTSISFKDKNVYRLNDKYLKIEGSIGQMEVRAYPSALLECGLGRFGVLGGGRSKCE